MQALTQEQAERAAKCCGPQWVSEVAVMSFTQRTDPDFWFPRLWQELRIRCPKFNMIGDSNEPRFEFHLGSRIVWNDDMFLALLEAIEAL